MAVNHHTEPAGGSVGRDQTYRMVAELLVGYRRIVLRGLQRVYGDSWWEAGCPRAVRERILKRQEAEREVDRFSAEGDEAFAYANFADLADVVESVPDVADLMRTLSPSAGRLSESLRSLEEVRSKIAGIRPVSEAEQVALAETHLRLREKLAGARRRAHAEEAPADDDGVSQSAEFAAETITQPVPTPTPPAPPDAKDDAVSADEAAPDSIAAAAAAPPVKAEPATAAAPSSGGEAAGEATPTAATLPETEHSASGGGDGKAESAEERRRDQLRRIGGGTKRTPERLSVAASTSGPARSRRAFDPVGAAALDGAPTPVGLVRVDGDDMVVLRDLRREIIAAAEAAYAHAEAIGMDVWTTAWDSGWFSRKLERYALGEVATFYAIMEQYLERRRKGTVESAMRTFLADRELAKLLLRLRELFLRLRV